MAKAALMSMLSSVKDAMLGRAMKLVGDPRVAKVLADPRLMGAAMKAVEVGGAVKGEVDKVSRIAAGAMGWATHQEVEELRGTIETLQDTVVSLETRAAAAEARAQEAEAKLAEAGKAGGGGAASKPAAPGAEAPRQRRTTGARKVKS